MNQYEQVMAEVNAALDRILRELDERLGKGGDKHDGRRSQA